MSYSEGDRVHIHFRPELVGTVTADHDPMFGRMVGVNWDSGDFAFVNPVKLAFATPGMSEADRAALSKAYNLAIGAVESVPNWQARALAAEAKVARVEAVYRHYDRHDRPRGVHRFSVAQDIRAALDGVDRD